MRNQKTVQLIHPWERSWILICLGALSTFSLAGCRFGNRLEKALSPDQWSGYYALQPQKVTFYATVSSEATTRQKDVSPSLIPQSVQQVLSNPVKLILKDFDTGRAILAAPKSKVGIPIQVHFPDLSLDFEGSSTPGPLWIDPQCLTYRSLSEKGKLTLNPLIESPQGNALPLMGNIDLDYQMITQFQGDCAATFQGLAQCYQDPTQCGESSVTENLKTQSRVMAYFQPYLQSQVLTVSDIPHVQNFAFEIVYH